MGVNQIGLLFQPTHYVKIDFSPFDTVSWQKQVTDMTLSGATCLLWDVFRDGVPDKDAPFGDWIPEGIGEQPNTTWVSRCEHHANMKMPDRFHKPICTAYNSLVPMVQWAEKLGFDEIVLLGCDGHYTDGKTDHFTENYYQTVDEGYQQRNNEMTQKAHEFIRANCTIPIYNATPDSVLDMYPKVDLKGLGYG